MKKDKITCYVEYAKQVDAENMHEGDIESGRIGTDESDHGASTIPFIAVLAFKKEYNLIKGQHLSDEIVVELHSLAHQLGEY